MVSRRALECLESRRKLPNRCKDGFTALMLMMMVIGDDDGDDEEENEEKEEEEEEEDLSARLPLGTKRGGKQSKRRKVIEFDEDASH